MGELAQSLEKMQTQLQLDSDIIVENIDDIHFNYVNTVKVLANAIEACDNYTRGHCDRVC